MWQMWNLTSLTDPDRLKKQVSEACMVLRRNDLSFSGGSVVSGIDRKNGLVVFQSYGTGDVSVVDFDKGTLIEGSSGTDIPLYLELYRRHPSAAGITHIRTQPIAFFADAGRELPLMGVPYTDYFGAPVPCRKKGDSAPLKSDISAELVPSLGAFTWGNTIMSSVEYAVILERMAKKAYTMEILSFSADIIRYK